MVYKNWEEKQQTDHRLSARHIIGTTYNCQVQLAVSHGVGFLLDVVRPTTE